MAELRHPQGGTGRRGQGRVAFAISLQHLMMICLSPTTVTYLHVLAQCCVFYALKSFSQLHGFKQHCTIMKHFYKTFVDFGCMELRAWIRNLGWPSLGEAARAGRNTGVQRLPLV